MNDSEQARIFSSATEETISAFVKLLDEHPEALDALAACIDVGCEPPAQVQASDAAPRSQTKQEMPTEGSIRDDSPREAAFRFRHIGSASSQSSIPRHSVPSHCFESASPGHSSILLRPKSEHIVTQVQPPSSGFTPQAWGFNQPDVFKFECDVKSAFLRRPLSPTLQLGGAPWLLDFNGLVADQLYVMPQGDASSIALMSHGADQDHREGAFFARSSSSALDSLFKTSPSSSASTPATTYSRLGASNGAQPATLHSLATFQGRSITPPFNDRSPASTATTTTTTTTTESLNRKRKRYNEVQRIFRCTHPGCVKAYASVSHLNTHRRRLGHGPPVRKVDLLETPGAINHQAYHHWPEPELIPSPASAYTTLNYSLSGEQTPPGRPSLPGDVALATPASFESLDGLSKPSKRQEQLGLLLELLFSSQAQESSSTDGAFHAGLLALSNAISSESS